MVLPGELRARELRYKNSLFLKEVKCKTFLGKIIFIRMRTAADFINSLTISLVLKRRLGAIFVTRDIATM